MFLSLHLTASSIDCQRHSTEHCIQLTITRATDDASLWKWHSHAYAGSDRESSWNLISDKRPNYSVGSVAVPLSSKVHHGTTRRARRPRQSIGGALQLHGCVRQLLVLERQGEGEDIMNEQGIGTDFHFIAGKVRSVRRTCRESPG